MQKVVGSNPIIRSIEAPLRRGFLLVLSLHDVQRTQFWKQSGNASRARDTCILEGKPKAGSPPESQPPRSRLSYGPAVFPGTAVTTNLRQLLSGFADGP